MAKITFKGKVQRMDIGGTHAYDYIKVPELDRKHCDMHAFRTHPKYGGLANSGLFKGVLSRIRKDKFGSSSALKLNAIPEGVQVDTSGFLAVVSFEV